jgi:hypothetical protein
LRQRKSVHSVPGFNYVVSLEPKKFSSGAPHRRFILD